MQSVDRRRRASLRSDGEWQVTWANRLPALIVLAGIIALAAAPDSFAPSTPRQPAKLAIFAPQPAAAAEEQTCAGDAGASSHP